MSEEVEKLEEIIRTWVIEEYPIGTETFLDLAQSIIKAGYLPVELVQLEGLGDKEIRYKLEEIQPEGFDWTDITDTEMIKFRAISQATITHNEAKGQLYRRVE